MLPAQLACVNLPNCVISFYGRRTVRRDWPTPQEPTPLSLLENALALTLQVLAGQDLRRGEQRWLCAWTSLTGSSAAAGWFVCPSVCHFCLQLGSKCGSSSWGYWLFPSPSKVSSPAGWRGSRSLLCLHQGHHLRISIFCFLCLFTLDGCLFLFKGAIKWYHYFKLKKKSDEVMPNMLLSLWVVIQRQKMRVQGRYFAKAEPCISRASFPVKTSAGSSESGNIT